MQIGHLGYLISVCADAVSIYSVFAVVLCMTSHSFVSLTRSVIGTTLLKILMLRLTCHEMSHSYFLYAHQKDHTQVRVCGPPNPP